jgi:hypothetical protein
MTTFIALISFAAGYAASVTSWPWIRTQAKGISGGRPAPARRDPRSTASGAVMLAAIKQAWPKIWPNAILIALSACNSRPRRGSWFSNERQVIRDQIV